MFGNNKDAACPKTICAIGKFDGVHTGHKKLLITASKLAADAGLVSVCLVMNSAWAQMLLSLEQREEVIKSLGFNKIVVQNLTPDFMNMSAEDFVKDFLLKTLNCAHVVVGYNFRFAKGRSADANHLKSICKDYKIECTIIPEVICQINSKKITASSTNVRDFLFNGDVKSASLILGRPYCISGEVVHGKQIGRTIKTPTANINCPSQFILPKSGVYATKAYIDGMRYSSVTNIGNNPTVNDDGKITIETNILNFNGNIYGKNITIEFTDRIRDEKKFNSLEELREQIKKDIEYVLLTK